jgi:ATP-dependent protease ClpP protease subunit
MKILIDDVIGGWYGIGERGISEKLAAIAGGEEIEIIINSPGGDCYEAIAIFNLIRSYAKTHTVIVRINGLAASAATYIALAARTVKPESKIIISENSIFMIHNPWIYIWGDYRELSKFADYMEQLASMFGSTYSAVSKQTEKKIRELMDAETYLVGEDIVSNGFANYFEKINETENAGAITSRDSLLVNARASIEKMAETVRANFKKENLDRAAALIGTDTFKNAFNRDAKNNTFQTPKGDVPSGNEGGIMNEEELREKYPALYNSIFEKGKTAGADAALEKERERIGAHLDLGEKAGAAGMKAAAKFIREGAALSNDKVQAEYIALLANNKNIENRNADNPGDTSLAGDDDDAKLEAAFDSGVKSGKGE